MDTFPIPNLTNKTIEEILTIIINKISGEDKHQSTLENDIIPIYNGLLKTNDEYLKFYNTIILDTKNGTLLEGVLDKLNNQRVLNETSRRSIYTKIDTIIETCYSSYLFSPKRTAKKDLTYFFFVSCKEYFGFFNTDLENMIKDLKFDRNKLKDLIRSWNCISYYCGHFTKLHGFVTILSKSKTDEKTKSLILHDFMSKYINEIRIKWDDISKYYFKLHC